MAKYLDNPFNPLMFISYNQRVSDLSQRLSTDPEVERSINLDVAYSKFKKAVPQVLCIGSPGSLKSTMLNDIFGTQFEVIEEGSACLFHDSVDAIFTSKELPIGFNVFDFQGAFANNDFRLISHLLDLMPWTYLLI